jgi:hypothetical protein
MEQRPGQYVGVESIGPGCRHQFAKLAHAAFLERLRLVGQRLEFRSKSRGLRIAKSFIEWRCVMIR